MRFRGKVIIKTCGFVVKNNIMLSWGGNIMPNNLKDEY